MPLTPKLQNSNVLVRTVFKNIETNIRSEVIKTNSFKNVTWLHFGNPIIRIW